MPVTRPNKRQLNELAESMGMNFSPEDLDFFQPWQPMTLSMPCPIISLR